MCVNYYLHKKLLLVIHEYEINRYKTVCNGAISQDITYICTFNSFYESNLESSIVQAKVYENYLLENSSWKTKVTLMMMHSEWRSLGNRIRLVTCAVDSFCQIAALHCHYITLQTLRFLQICFNLN